MMEAAALVPTGYRLLLADRPDLLDQVWDLRVLAWQTQACVTVQAGGGVA
jgi:hypothetical protein